MRVTHHADGGGVRLALEGELDIATVDVVGRHVDRALRARPGSLTVDLTQLHFCDSTGISTLLDARAAAATRGARFQVVGAHGITRTVMRILGVLDDLA